MNSMKFGGLVAAVVLATAPAFAQSGVQISQDGRPERIFRPVSGLDNTDVAFLKNAAIANMFEIESSRLAGEKSQDPFVQEFAKEMVIDHTLLLEELKGIAQNKGVSLPQNLPGSLQHTFNHLMNLSGGAFDNAFQQAQKYGHEDASRLFKAEIEDGRDQDVKGYAVKTLPVVDMHYKMMLTRTTEMGPTQMKGGG